MTVRLIEGQVPYTGGTAIEITADKVINLLLRSEDNLLQVNQDNELYCDLQLANGIAPNDDFPVGVTTGIVNANDGRPQNGLLLHYETTSGAYAQWLYAGDGHFYLDGGTGTFKKVYYADEVDAIFQQLVDMIGDGILTIQENGATVGTFSANQKTNTTVNITVPTKLSDLQNDLVNDGKLTIKENNVIKAEFTANDSTNVFVNLPGVINNTTTPDSANSLSAAMGKELQDQINNINSIGRFLSLWNCATGLPQTNPTTSPYMYHTGDYYVVGNVDTTTNYKPDGGSYTIGVASTTVETLTVGVGDMYFYDGTNRTLKKFTGQTFPIDNVLSTTSTNAVENRVVTNALLGKADLVSSAVSGNLAGLDSNGNLTDSGVDPNDLAEKTDINVKTFTISSTSDLTNAQAAYDWLKEGNNPLISYNGWIYTLTTSSATTVMFTAPGTFIDNEAAGKTAIEDPCVIFTVSSDVVTAITVNTPSWLGDYLRTGHNYTTPYTPEYPGSPATKKYVDDHTVSSGTTAPASPTTGSLWFDTNSGSITGDSLKVYSNLNAWEVVLTPKRFEWFTPVASANIVIIHFNEKFTPTQNFTIYAQNAPGELFEGMQYILRVESGATAYTMTLGTGITNPYGESLTLTASKTTTFVFLATSDSTLELFSVRTES